MVKKIGYLIAAYVVNAVEHVDGFLSEKGFVSREGYRKRAYKRADFILEKVYYVLGDKTPGVDAKKKGGD